MEVLARMGMVIALEIVWFAIGYARGRVVTYKESSAILLGIMIVYAFCDWVIPVGNPLHL